MRLCSGILGIKKSTWNEEEDLATLQALVPFAVSLIQLLLLLLFGIKKKC